MPVALITGASRGLGCAVANALAERGWTLVVDGRDRATLETAAAGLRQSGASSITAVVGDVADPPHRAELAAAVTEAGRLDLLVNNASVLGPSPQPSLAAYPLDQLLRVYEVNTFAPLALIQSLLAGLTRTGGCIIDISSDAAVEPYGGWGGYGSSKAALDQLTAILGAEHPGLRIYAFDPGDMRTDLHQAAFPGEDISDRPWPETVVPALLRLATSGLPNGRYRAADVGTRVSA